MQPDDRGYITDEDKLELVRDLNERGHVEGYDDYQSMVRRALNCAAYVEGDELRLEYGLED